MSIEMNEGKVVYMHTMEDYCLKEELILQYVITWMNFEDIK